MINPPISVVMPVYNSGKYLADSIESILNQTFRDFEFLIIDDSSTDFSHEIINKYLREDSRLRLLQNKYAKGIVGALNTGLEESGGKFIARMDADDISLPNRFERQYQFMETHSNISICGSWAEVFGHKSGLTQMPETDEEIKTALLFYNCLAHPTIMMKRSDLLKHHLSYGKLFSSSVDYDLWSRSIAYLHFHNIPDVLLKYRVHETQISTNRKEEQKKNSKKIKRYLLETVGIYPTEDQLNLHYELGEGSYMPATLEDVERITVWLSLLGKRKNIKVRHPLFDKYAERFIIDSYSKFVSEGIEVLKSFTRTSLFSDKISPRGKAYFVVRCIYRSFLLGS